MARLPLAACAVAAAFYLCLHLASSSSSAPRLAPAPSDGGRRAGRTAYHFQPAKNWQNGPMYYNGMYHLFYQYNPHGALWGVGNLSWGHSVSGDLVNWAALDTALDPTSPFDANGCWSGSATILPGGTPAILYTGIDANGEQVQNVAFPRDPADPLLRRWDKPGYNPVIPLPADVPGDKFRDPSTAWLGRDGLWRVAVSAEVRGVASTLVYRSADFLRWERAPAAAPLHASRAAGMVECPDLFPVKEEGDDGDGQGLDASASGAGLRHVLKLSVMDTLQDYYMVGRYDDAADAFVPAEPERGDDVRGWRRLDYGHTFPRKLWLDEDGKQLRQWPVEEIETLRRKRVVLRRGTALATGGMNEIVGVAGSQADVEVAFKVSSLAGAEALDPNWLLDPQKLCGEKGASVPGGVGPFGLIVMASSDLREHTAVFFRAFRYHGRSSTRAGVYKPPYGGFVDVDVEEHETINLRTLIDHSVVESFGADGRMCITARVYPEHAETSNNHMFVFNNGTGTVEVYKLEAWELAAATVNSVGGNDSLVISKSNDQSESY
ncbi:invertase cell wall4 [Zea mays]|uniref:Invertase cell wall4 n=1 Tax=Zea mays TaxID=4577 RepID=A0A1D6DUP5_MAIZE|nr:invertase cell wall4 [Zea mays]